MDEFSKAQVTSNSVICLWRGFYFDPERIRHDDTDRRTVCDSCSLCASSAKRELEGTDMQRVTGIGGFFFLTNDPKASAHWYLQHLAISLVPSSYEDSVWQQGFRATEEISRPIFTVCAGMHRFQQIGVSLERKADAPICWNC
jgi:hypothetical protein